MRTFKDEAEALGFLDTKKFGIAAGVLRDQKAALAYASAGANVVSYGSMIAEEGWGGNPGDNFHYDDETGNSINAMGLGDPGIKRHLETLPETRTKVNEIGAELWVSFSARKEFKAEDYRNSASALAMSKAADVGKANAACPNVEDDTGKRKPVLCFDLPKLDEAVAAFTEGAGVMPTAVKLAPNTEARILCDQLDICRKYGVKYVILGNTLGNCHLKKPDGSHAISMIRGGLAGRALQPIVRGMLMIAVPHLKGSGTEVIACGGVDCGEIAYDYLWFGASGWLYNSYASRKGGGPKTIPEILFGLVDNHGKRRKGLLQLMIERGLPE